MATSLPTLNTYLEVVFLYLIILVNGSSLSLLGMASRIDGRLLGAVFTTLTSLTADASFAVDDEVGDSSSA